jgi:CheY-like chemotaxis protein
VKILIAEDNPTTQEFTGALMEDWEYEFDMASNGLEAVTLATAHEGQYDLCLMDMDMPIMNGWEAAKIIR